MFSHSHVDEQLFSCELLSIFQVKGLSVSLGDCSSNNPVWRHPRSSAGALPWDGEELGQGLQQPGDGAAWLSTEQEQDRERKAGPLQGSCP